MHANAWKHWHLFWVSFVLMDQISWSKFDRNKVEQPGMLQVIKCATGSVSSFVKGRKKLSIQETQDWVRNPSFGKSLMKVTVFTRSLWCYVGEAALSSHTWAQDGKSYFYLEWGGSTLKQGQGLCSRKHKNALMGIVWLRHLKGNSTGEIIQISGSKT